MFLSNLYVVASENNIKKIQLALRDVESKTGHLGFSTGPFGRGINFRILGTNYESIKEATFKIVKIIRNEIINAPFSGIRKM